MGIESSLAAELDPIFLELGKALYTCQGFEETLVFMLSVASHDERNTQVGAFVAAFDLYADKTLGQLLKALDSKVTLPLEVRDCLNLGWQRRNFIVHQFIHDAGLALADPKGRMQVLAQLTSYKQEVRIADKVANALLDQLLEKHGTSVADMKRAADVLWEHLNPGDAGERH